MGGMELLSALESVVQQRTREDFSTQIIVLTDGEVWDTENTIDFVRKTRIETAEKVRFFALGIGDAVSHRLVEGIGREGGGLAEVVAVDVPGRWESRVIRMLKGALTPSRWQCEITLGGGCENSIPSTIFIRNSIKSLRQQCQCKGPRLYRHLIVYLLCMPSRDCRFSSSSIIES